MESSEVSAARNESITKKVTKNEKSSWISNTCQHLEPCRAWIALVAAVLSNLLLDLSDAFGVYYDALVDKYDAKRADVGWILSIRWIFIFLGALFISPFIEKYGCKPVTSLFGLMYALGTILSAIAPNVPSLYFIYGFLTGFGNSGIYLAEISAIQFLFSTNRGFATCIAALGFPVGIIIHPLHTRYFLQLYGVSGVFLIHGAISLHAVVFAFAFNTSPQKKEQTRKNETNRCWSSKTEKISNLPGEKQANVGSGTTSSGQVVVDDVPTNTSVKCAVVKEYFKEIFDFKVLRNVNLVLVIIHFFLLWMIRLGISTQIVNCAKFRGLPDDKASYLLSVSGAASLVMTVVSALVMNTSWSNPALYSASASLCLCGSAFGCAFSNSYGTFLASAALMGIADGIAMSILPLLTLYVIGLEKFPRSMAVVWTMLVPSAVGSSAFVGWVVDMLASYVIAFVVLALGGVISTFLAVAIAIAEARKRKRRQISDINPGVISDITIDTRM